jgi:type 1 fimbria pilin
MLSKKMLLAVATASLIAVPTSSQAASDTASINITATVVDNTCTPQWSTSGVNVEMNRVSLKDFGGDKVGATKDFTLSLDGCGSGATTVKVTAKGDSDTTDGVLFKNTVSNGATGVGVGIWGDNSQATQMKPDASNSVTYAIENSKVDMKFLAKLMLTGKTAPGTGEVKSVVTMTVDYQ